MRSPISETIGKRNPFPVAIKFSDTDTMLAKTIYLLLGITALSLIAGFRESAKSTVAGPEYTHDGQLKFPEHYREWVYLTSGFDMSYNPGAQAASHHVFDTVFVNPEAYRAFIQTGTWPDGTSLVLENRGAESKARSIGAVTIKALPCWVSKCTSRTVPDFL